jgi:hypothetical protein
MSVPQEETSLINYLLTNILIKLLLNSVKREIKQWERKPKKLKTLTFKDLTPTVSTFTLISTPANKISLLIGENKALFPLLRTKVLADLAGLSPLLLLLKPWPT